MSKQEFDEKNEKQDEKDEKELQKHEEKSAEEKWQRDPLGAIVWGFILIWAGVVFLLDNVGALDSLVDFFRRFGLRQPDIPFDAPFMRFEAWSLVLIGAGLILLLEVLFRLLVPHYRRPILGTVILAIVFIGLGLGSFGAIWPLILIAIGVAILLGSLRRKA